MNQVSGSTRSTHYRIPTSVQHQAGKSSEMGAARAAEMTGTKTIWPDSEVRRHESFGAMESAILASIREEKMDGEHDGEVGLGEESSTLLLSSILESAEILTPVKSSKQLSDLSTSLLCDETLTPVECFKWLPSPSEIAGDLGFIGPLPMEQPK